MHVHIDILPLLYTRVQAAALRHLLPDFLSSLCDELHVKSSFTDTTVCFEGSSMAIQEASAKMQQQLSLFQIHQFPILQCRPLSWFL